MKIGDRIIHKLTGQKMTIKRIGENGLVATLIKDIPEPWTFRGIEYVLNALFQMIGTLTK